METEVKLTKLAQGAGSVSKISRGLAERWKA